MKDIAREAGVAQGLLHYYFTTRDRLFSELVARLLDQHLTRFRAALARSAADERRAVGLGFLRDRALGDKSSWRVLFEALANASRDEYGPVIAKRFAERRALVAAQIGGTDADAKALVLDALLLGLAAERLAGATDAEVENALVVFERVSQ